MGAIKDLLESERGLIALALIIGGTVLCATRVMTVDQWKDFTTWVFGAYVAGKTVTGAVQIIKGPAPNAAPPQGESK
jgi:hypothetical protein